MWKVIIQISARPNLGAPHTASNNGSYCAGVPSQSVPAESVPATKIEASQSQLLLDDAQNRDNLDWCTPVVSTADETPGRHPSPEASHPAPPMTPAAELPAPSPATPTPTVPESTVPGSPERDGDKSKRGVSPSYFRLLGIAMIS